MNEIVTVDPATGAELGRYPGADAATLDAVLQRSVEAQRAWREVPVEQRTAPLRRLADLLRDPDTTRAAVARGSATAARSP